MCHGILVNLTGNHREDREIHFQRGVQIPVYLRDGSVKWCHWGLPEIICHLEQERAIQTGLPRGATVSRDAVREGRFDHLGVRPVKLAAGGYMYWRDRAQTRRDWWMVPPGMAMQGMLAGYLVEGYSTEWFYSVFVVTVPAQVALAQHTQFAPRLVPLSP